MTVQWLCIAIVSEMVMTWKLHDNRKRMTVTSAGVTSCPALNVWRDAIERATRSHVNGSHSNEVCEKMAFAATKNGHGRTNCAFGKNRLGQCSGIVW